MRQQLGQQGEQLAARYLKKLGYRVLGHNVRRAGCEIDVIAQDGAEVVFVEVKTRRSRAAGHPEESVTPQKLQHISRAAEVWLLEHGEQPWRVDVISIELLGSDPKITHFKGV